MTDQLDPRLARQLAGRCCYGACRDDALDGSDYCGKHDAHERGRGRTRTARRRQKLAADGRCITGCGRKVPRKRRRGGGFVLRRCRSCAKRLAAAAKANRANARSVTGDSRSVTGESTARGFVRLDTSDKREGRGAVERYVGRGRRGAPSREDRDEDLRADLEDAIAAITRVRTDGIARLRSPAVAELGAIARREASAEVADLLLRAARICTAAADDLCRGRAAEVEAARRVAE